MFEKISSVITYLFFTCVLILPVIWVLSTPCEDRHSKFWVGFVNIWWLHLWYVLWLVSLVILPLSLFCQWLVMHGKPVPQSLSVRGLGAQAIIFTLLGISWTWRMDVSREAADPTGDDGRGLERWWYWYISSAYLVINHLLFGAIQGLLYGYVWLWRRGEAKLSSRNRAQGAEALDDEGIPSLDETSPLLDQSRPLLGG